MGLKNNGEDNLSPGDIRRGRDGNALLIVESQLKYLLHSGFSEDIDGEEHTLTMRFSKDFHQALNERVNELVAVSVGNAVDAGRSTPSPKDLPPRKEEM